MLSPVVNVLGFIPLSAGGGYQMIDLFFQSSITARHRKTFSVNP
jgi:hypothetical protein